MHVNPFTANYHAYYDIPVHFGDEVTTIYFFLHKVYPLDYEGPLGGCNIRKYRLYLDMKRISIGEMQSYQRILYRYNWCIRHTPK